MQTNIIKMKPISRGLRNCNPGNIRNNKDIFQGEVKPSKDKSFKEFRTMAYGYRAMFVDLSNKLKRGLNTIEKIICIWAPPNENNTPAYIAKVVEWSGVSKDKELTEYDGKDFIKIVAAMSRVENSVDADIEDVEAGFRLQDRIKAK